MNNYKLFALVPLLSLLFSTGGLAHSFLHTRLKGTEEVPGPGDPDGVGYVLLALKPEAQKICYLLYANRILAATAAHIHKAPEGSAGPVVVPLSAPTDGVSGGCIENIDQNLIDDIAEHPEEYYVNVHNADHPAGAIRGQLGHTHLEDDTEIDEEIPSSLLRFLN